MSRRKPLSDKEEFMRALQLWDRPDSELRGKVLENDTDIDAHLDRVFSMPGAGMLTD